MKAYLVTTGMIFIALVVAHVLRVFQEDHLVRDPWFVGTTAIALGLAMWAFRLYLTVKGSRKPTV